MITIIRYNKFPFNICVKIKDGEILDTLPETKAILYENCIIVRDGMPLIEHYDKDGNEQDISFVNTNVICLDMDSNLIWRIQKCEAKFTPSKFGQYQCTPYMNVSLHDNKLLSYNIDGWLYEVNPENGHVKRYMYVK